MSVTRRTAVRTACSTARRRVRVNSESREAVGNHRVRAPVLRLGETPSRASDRDAGVGSAAYGEDIMLRRVRIALVAAAPVALFLAALLPASVRGLPSFSRSYAVSCTRCHRTFSGLNRDGMEFLENGYRMPAGLGWSRLETRHLPLSVAVDLSHAFTKMDGIRGRRVTSRSEREMEFQRGAIGLHAAGTLRGRVTFHFRLFRLWCG